MPYAFDARDGATVIRLRGVFDGGPEGTQLYDELRARCTAARPRLIVDCRDVTRVSPRGLGALTAALALARNNGGDLVLACVPRPVRSLLIITDLRRAFATYDSVDAACTALFDTTGGAR